MRALSGIKEMTPVEKYAYQLASNMYSEPVGLYYGEKYFGEEAKKDITEIVYQIIDTYKSRIKNNDILGDETKEKAILKLSKMGVKMGYPDKVEKIYDLLMFNEEDSLFDIVKSLRKVKVLEEDEKSHQVKLSIKDFDYRIGKKKIEKIQETEHGFTTLESKLGDWIEEKYKEITKK